MRTRVEAPDHSGSQAQPETVAPAPVPSTRRTAPPAPSRTFPAVVSLLGVTSLGQTSPGSGAPALSLHWVSAAALAVQALLQTSPPYEASSAPSAPQQAGISRQTAVVQGLQSQGSAAPV